MSRVIKKTIFYIMLVVSLSSVAFADAISFYDFKPISIDEMYGYDTNKPPYRHGMRLGPDLPYDYYPYWNMLTLVVKLAITFGLVSAIIFLMKRILNVDNNDKYKKVFCIVRDTARLIYSAFAIVMILKAIVVNLTPEAGDIVYTGDDSVVFVNGEAASNWAFSNFVGFNKTEREVKELLKKVNLINNSKEYYYKGKTSVIAVNFDEEGITEKPVFKVKAKQKIKTKDDAKVLSDELVKKGYYYVVVTEYDVDDRISEISVYKQNGYISNKK